MPPSPQLIPRLPRAGARTSVSAMLGALAILALPGSAHALATASTATTAAASVPTTTTPATGGTAIAPTTTTATPTTTAPATTTTTTTTVPGAVTTDPSPTTTVTTSAATPTHTTHAGKISTPAIALAVLAALLALACAAWAAVRLTAFEPRWLSSARHALAEGGFRISATWAEFTDWARLGK
ncbi:MAG: hypothetical protein ACYDHN_00295 [Solirubrobacteraceae bacterium]